MQTRSRWLTLEHQRDRQTNHRSFTAALGPNTVLAVDAGSVAKTGSLVPIRRQHLQLA